MVADPFALAATIELAPDPGPDTDTSGRGVPNYVQALAISPDGRRAFVGAKKDNTARGAFRDGLPLTPENSVRALVGQIDMAAGGEDLPARLDLDNRNLPSAIAFSDLGDYVFVAAQGNDRVEVLDAYDATPVALIDHVGSAPDGLALSPDGRLFVNALIGRSVRVFDVRAILDSSDFAGVFVGEVTTVADEPLAPEVLAGKRIFYDSEDPRMSREGYLSCATCHLGGFEDGRVFDFTDRGEGLRNTVSLLGRRGTGHGRVHWSANFDEIQDFENDIRNAFGGTGLMSDADFAAGTRSETLGDPKAGLSADLDALAAYVASLDHVRASPFRNPDGSMTADAVAGRDLFAKLGCGGCHVGEDFTDSAKGELHDVGTITPASGSRLGGELTGIDTPTLLGVWETAPYLHDGSAPTLRDVLTTRNPGDLHGATSGLSVGELGQLEAYVRQLDSELPVRELPTFPKDAAPRPEAGCACRAGAPAGEARWVTALAVAALLAVRRRAAGRGR